MSFAESVANDDANHTGGAPRQAQQFSGLRFHSQVILRLIRVAVCARAHKAFNHRNLYPAATDTPAIAPQTMSPPSTLKIYFFYMCANVQSIVVESEIVRLV